MKRILLSLFVCFIISFGVANAQTQLEVFPYDSGSLAGNGSFETPEWITNAEDGKVPAIYNKTGLDPKDKADAFYSALGIEPSGSSAYALRIAKTDGFPDRALILTLSKCEKVTVYFWGTGSRGLELTNSVNSETAFVGVDSYVVGEVSLDVKSDVPVKVNLKPTAKNGNASTGDTYIHRIVVTHESGNASVDSLLSTEKGEPVSVEYYNTVGQQVKKDNYKGILIKRSTYADGSVDSQKVYLQ